MLSFETLQLSSLDFFFFFFLNERSWLLEAASSISIFQIIYEALRNKKQAFFLTLIGIKLLCWQLIFWCLNYHP